jgi:hypothetical protein
MEGFHCKHFFDITVWSEKEWYRWCEELSENDLLSNRTCGVGCIFPYSSCGMGLDTPFTM